jgi:hypothetical protein
MHLQSTDFMSMMNNRWIHGDSRKLPYTTALLYYNCCTIAGSAHTAWYPWTVIGVVLEACGAVWNLELNRNT